MRNLSTIDAGAPRLPERLDRLAEAHGERIALRDPSGALSYGGLAAMKSRVAAWAVAHHVAPGDVVCLMMPNAAQYPAIWAGLTQAGAVVALLNTQLREDALVQAIGAARPGHAIIHADLLPAIRAVADRLPPRLACWVANGAPETGVAAFTLEDDPRPRAGHATGPLSQTALLIYTSGTTGWPKSARISHYRILEWSLWFAGIAGLTGADRLYDCLPMYHSTGGVAAPIATLLAGGCVTVRPGFSASRFWPDVAAERSTVFLYIGELCRYLLSAPAGAAEAEHTLRLACGNGLRGDIWQKFMDRFRIPQVLEFYASTEGNVSLYNCEGRPGAVGRLPGWLRQRPPVRVVHCAPETSEIARDEAGRCLPCAPGESGEMIGRIDKDAERPGAFDGYSDPEATEAKILRDVFEPGDAWFRTGDLMRQDSDGFFTFVDRLGDTFRWKGENVATNQVAEILCAAPGVMQAVVYGVALEDNDGKAGMAAITVRDGFEASAVHAHLAAALPAYAIPLFIRVRPALDITGTFKLQRAQLAREGYSRLQPGDRLYRLDERGGTYLPTLPHPERRVDQEGGGKAADAGVARRF